MATTSIVCSGCGADVPYGRLSCPECGELLASVAGSHRSSGSDEAADVGAPTAGGGPAGSVPAVLMDVKPDQGLDALTNGASDDAPDTDGHQEPAGPEPIPVTAAMPLAAPVAAAPASATPVVTGAPIVAALSAPAPTPVTAPLTPGAYVPPVLVAAPVAATALPSGPAAPARAWGGPGADAGGTDPAPSGGATAAEAASSASSRGKIEEFARWLAIAGSALAAVGFLLPWSSSVIGATGVGYFDRWGLAGPAHLLLFVALLAIPGLALLGDRIAAWARIGIPGVAMGALLIGLAWPYLIGPLRFGAGILAVVVGAGVLFGAGVLAIVEGRHVRGSAVV